MASIDDKVPSLVPATEPQSTWAQESTTSLETRGADATRPKGDIAPIGVSTTNPWSSNQNGHATFEAGATSKDVDASEPPIPPRSSLRPSPSPTAKPRNEFIPLMDDLSNSVPGGATLSRPTQLPPTPGPKVPGAYPHEVTEPNEHVDVGTLFESAKQYVPATEDITRAVSAAGETAAGYSAVVMAKLSSLLPNGMSTTAGTEGEQLNDQIRDFGTNGRTYVDSVTGLAVDVSPTPAFEIADPTNSVQFGAITGDKVIGSDNGKGKETAPSVQFPQTTATLLDNPDSLNEDESGAGHGVAGMKHDVGKVESSRPQDRKDRKIEPGVIGVGVAAASRGDSETPDDWEKIDSVQRANANGVDRHQANPGETHVTGSQDLKEVRFDSQPTAIGKIDEFAEPRGLEPSSLNTSPKSATDPGFTDSKVAAPTPPPKDTSVNGRSNTNATVGATSQLEWGQTVLNTAPTHGYSLPGATAKDGIPPAPSPDYELSPQANDFEVHHKSTFKNKVKGEMKIIKGKLSKNAEEVEAGQRLKAGY